MPFFTSWRGEEEKSVENKYFFLRAYGTQTVLVITEKAERKTLELMKGVNSADVSGKAMSAEA